MRSSGSLMRYRKIRTLACTGPVAEASPHWARRRIAQIGARLIEGPRSIIPPEELDDFGWLEPDLHLRLYHIHSVIRESLTIFCDNTINREEGFLDPVLRYARWNWSKDRVDLPKWPSVDVTLSHFNEHKALVDEQIRRIQTALSEYPFVVSGLILDHQLPDDVDVNWDRGMLTIITSNGMQSMEFHSPAPSEGNTLGDLFFEVFSSLRSILQPMSGAGWKEAYDIDLDANYPLKSWYWDGEPPTRHGPQEQN